MRVERTQSRTNAVVCKNNIRIPIFTKKEATKKQGSQRPPCLAWYKIKKNYFLTL